MLGTIRAAGGPGDTRTGGGAHFGRRFLRAVFAYTGRPVTAATVKRPATWKEKWASRQESDETKALVG